jgi:hypothetical protein
MRCFVVICVYIFIFATLIHLKGGAKAQTIVKCDDGQRWDDSKGRCVPK